MSGRRQGAAPLEFAILGPLVVTGDAGDVRIAGGRRRALLVRLLIASGRPVAAARLAEDLWDNEPPPGAASTLQSHVSLLRQSLGAERIKSRDGGYVLELAEGELDTQMFEREARQGRQALESADPASAAELLARALARWRGPALADVAGAGWAAAETARLEELHAAALEVWLEARLALGEHQEVAALAEAAVAEHPLQERLWRLLMLALYRSGRQADALRAFQRLRAHLGEELGIDPSTDLVELDEAILLQKVELDWVPPPTVAAEPAPAPRADGESTVVVRPGAAGGPQAAKSRPAKRHNLPEEMSSFVGRERELAAIARLLEENRLVTLTGPGGAGKTRLALRVAAGLVDDSEDGVWLVELGALDDGALVAPTAAAALGVPESGGRPALEAIVDYLAQQALVLLLDNCEHLIKECAVLADAVLRSCPRVTIVATSRERLGVNGEQLFAVPSMSVPSAGVESPEQLAAFEAVRLFIERASQEQPDFAIDPGNAAAVASVCRHLDGIPLAIELAAARLRSLSVTEIDDRLSRRFSLLTAGKRTALPRQQTLRALIDWSHDLLTPRERSFFARLSVFVGGFSLEAAEAVCPGDEVDRADVFDLLDALVAKSLVQVEAAEQSTRYRLLETVREYASDRLAEEGDESARALRNAHLRYYLQLGQEAAPKLRGAGDWLDRLEVELDNFRAALACSLEDEGSDAGLALAASLRYLWDRRGHIREGVAWLTRLLEQPPPAESAGAASGRPRRGAGGGRGSVRSEAADGARKKEGRDGPRGAALAAAGFLEMRLGEFEAARLHLEEALALARLGGDDSAAADALIHLAYVALYRGEQAQALAFSDEALALARAAGDRHMTALALHTLAMSDPSDPATARARMEESVATLRGVGDGRLIAGMLMNLAVRDIEDGDLDAAHLRLEESLAIARAVDNAGELPYHLVNLGFVAAARESWDDSGERFREALTMCRRLGHRSGVSYCLLGLGLVATGTGDDLRGAALLGAFAARAERTALSVEPLEAGLRDRNLASLRERLGAAALDEALGRGHALAEEEAIALALSGDKS
jgi:predicted ATPase/DNA-binding SARP family transcriptional activator